MTLSDDKFCVFAPCPALDDLAPERYADSCERGFDAPLDFPLTDERTKRLFERRETRLGFDVDRTVDPAFAADVLEHGVGVAGAGLMGVSIAAAFVNSGVSVLAYDPFPQALAAAPERMRKELAAQRFRRGEALADHDAETAFVAERVAALYRTTDSLEALAERPAIVESIPEKLKLKSKFYRELDRAARRSLLLLTNTSSLRVADLAAGLSVDPGANVCNARFCAFHFFHPVARRNLVEIGLGESTSNETLARALFLGKTIRKLPIVVDDGPGLLVNRLLQAYLNEALRLLDEGVAPARLEDVCRRMGMEGAPLRVIDEIGVDVSMHAGWSFLKAFPERTHNSAALAGLAREGRLGRKSKLGFYRYGSNESWADDAVFDCAAQTLERLRADAFSSDSAPTNDAAGLDDAAIALRVLDAILAEAKRAVDEKIVGSYREVDAGLTLALGFPRAKGGICYWAMAVGRF